MSSILTLEQLKKACSKYQDKFKLAYGTSVEITEALAIEQAANWDWDWAAQHLLTPENLAEYQRVMAQAWAEYQRVMAQAWARLYIAQGGGVGSNCINTIAPYRHNGVWVFDDPDVGLCKEPFISGADAIIDRLVEHLPNAAKGFILIFSAEPFPGYTAELNRTRQEFGGNWYYCKKFDLEGWLCPALYKYFEVAPDRLFIAARRNILPGVTA